MTCELTGMGTHWYCHTLSWENYSGVLIHQLGRQSKNFDLVHKCLWLLHMVLRNTSEFHLAELQKLVYSYETAISNMTTWSRKNKGERFLMGHQKVALKEKHWCDTFRSQWSMFFPKAVNLISRHSLFSKQTVRCTVYWLTRDATWVGHQCFCILSRDFHQSNKTQSLGLLLLYRYLKKKGKRYNFWKATEQKFTSAVGLYFQNVPNRHTTI